VRLLIFTIVAAVAFLVAYAFGLGGTVSTIIFLFILFNGALDRVAQPLLEKLRA
jgi:hypothetical protein